VRIPEAFYWGLFFVCFLTCLMAGLAARRIWIWCKQHWLLRQKRKAWRDMTIYGLGVLRNGKHSPYRKFIKP
jgi:hypothetical protein